MGTKIIQGDCIEQMKLLEENSVDAIVTDPPYGLEFMGKEWDKFSKGENIAGGTKAGKDTPFGRSKPLNSVYQYELSDKRTIQNFFFGWATECLRVLKPGGFLLAFGGTRTYHRLTCGIEDAGFEIRDTIMWLYGCLSEDTEILTINGWEHYHKDNTFIKDKEPILIYDNQKNIFKWERPERWQDYILNKDTCYRIQSDNTDQLVSRNHRCLVEREGKLLFIQAEKLSDMENMPTLSNDFLMLHKRQPKILLQEMQRILQRTGMEKVGEDRLNKIKSSREQNEERKQGGKESSMEGRNNLLQEERKLWEIQNKIYSLSKTIYNYGEKGWLCNGTPINNSKEIEKMLIENRSDTSQRPQPRKQSDREFNSIQDEQGTQNTRGIRIEKAKVTKEEYSGLVFCPTVTTGCFVARRNGKIFITGNSGFPKSLNIGKQIDKINGNEREVIGEKRTPDGKKWSDRRPKGNITGYKGNKDIIKDNSQNIETKGTSEWEGWGTALKPACEPIVVARKPLSEKNVALNVLKWGTGGINIDDCRIPTNPEVDDMKREVYRGERDRESDWSKNSGFKNETNKFTGVPIEGRFPANIIFECICDKTEQGQEKISGGFGAMDIGMSNTGEGKTQNYDPTKTKSKENKFMIHTDPNCPCYMLDEQTGNLSQGHWSKTKTKGFGDFGGGSSEYFGVGEKDKSKHGASRFFYCAKASKSERNYGCEEFESKAKCDIDKMGGEKCSMKTGSGNERNVAYKNNHPTVKPISLMEYLIKLVSKEGAVVLDPFLGSGTTLLACHKLNRNGIGIEKEEEYIKIAKARLNKLQEQKKLN